MNYILLCIITFCIAQWMIIRLFLTSFGKKKVFHESKDPAILSFIKEKTGLSLSSFRIQESAKPFGMMTGLPGKPIMILSSNLLKTFSQDEIEYVLLHEAGHYLLRHSIKMTLVFLFLLIPGFAILRLFPSLDIAGLLLLGTILGVVNIQYGRTREYEADRFAVQRLDDPKVMISATTIFKRSYNRPNQLLQNLFYGGVPYEKRVEMAEREILQRTTN